MNRRAPLLLATFALCSAPGCAALFGEDIPPPSPPPLRVIANLPFCARTWEDMPKGDAPPVEDFQALLGELVSAPEVEQMMSRLGKADVRRDDKQTRRSYPDRGLSLTFRRLPAGERLVSVELMGRHRPAKGYPGTLPAGLSFSQSIKDGEGAVLPPESVECGPYNGSCRYETSGMTVWGDGARCVDTVILRRPVADGQVRFDDVEIRSGVEKDGIHGVMVSFYLTLSAQLAGYDTPRTRVCLADGSGKKGGRKGGPPDKREELCEMVFSYPSAPEPERKSLFLSYAKLGLPAGPFTLRMKLESSMRPLKSAGSESALPDVTLKPEAESSFELTGEAPELSKVRIKVLRAEVTKDRRYDIAVRFIGTAGWERPDLFWCVRVLGGDPHCSSTAKDTYSASWSAASEPITVTSEDRFSLCLFDEDFPGSNEKLGCFDLTLESYLEKARSRQPLSSGAVTKLLLGPPIVSK